MKAREDIFDDAGHMPPWQPADAAAPTPRTHAEAPAPPGRLGLQALLELRDLMHQPSAMFAASSAELDLWLRQLDEAIDSGEIDPRPSWELEAEREAQRVAKFVLAALEERGGVDVANVTPTVTRAAAESPAPLPPLVRARDVGMTQREWRAAVHRGELLARKVGREYKATRADFDAYLAARHVSSAPRVRKVNGKRADAASAAIDRALASGSLRVIPEGGRR
jgi:hypothetical protein